MSRGDARVNGIPAKIETYSVIKIKIRLIKYKDREEIFFLPPDFGVTVLVSSRSLLALRKLP